MNFASFLKHFGEHMFIFVHVILRVPGRFLVDPWQVPGRSLVGGMFLVGSWQVADRFLVGPRASPKTP